MLVDDPEFFVLWGAGPGSLRCVLSGFGLQGFELRFLLLFSKVQRLGSPALGHDTLFAIGIHVSLAGCLPPVTYGLSLNPKP